MQLTNDPNWAELRDPKVNDKIQSAQLSANRSLDWGWFKGLDVGVAYNQRDKDVPSDSFYLELTGASDPRGASAAADPGGRVAGSGDDRRRRYPQRVLTWDVPGIMDLYTRSLKDPWEAQTNKFPVNEKITTGFLKFDIDTTWGTCRCAAIWAFSTSTRIKAPMALPGTMVAQAAGRGCRDPSARRCDL